MRSAARARNRPCRRTENRPSWVESGTHCSIHQSVKARWLAEMGSLSAVSLGGRGVKVTMGVKPLRSRVRLSGRRAVQGHAARKNVSKASASTSLPSSKSLARLVLPSGLELNRAEGYSAYVRRDLALARGDERLPRVMGGFDCNRGPTGM